MTDYCELVRKLEAQIEIGSRFMDNPVTDVECHAAISALTKRVKELEEALKPFVEADHSYRDEEADDTAWSVIVEVGDLRRARLVLSGKGV